MAMLFLRYKKATKVQRMLTYNFLVLPALLYTGFSRIYDGMHSFDQVLSGLLQGIIIAYLFVEVLDDYLIKLYKRAVNMSVFEILFSNRLAMIVWAGCFSFIILYDKMRPTYKMPDEWMNNLKGKCPELDEQKLNPMTQCLEFVMISAAALTCLLGASTE